MATDTSAATRTDTPTLGYRTQLALIAALVATLTIGVVLGFIGRGQINDGDTAPTPGTDQVEVGFAQDMSVHHSQAVEMSSMALSQAVDPAVRTLAYDVLTTQQSQIGTMHGWLVLWDQPTISTQPAMSWMRGATTSMPGHSMPADGTMKMPGMATPEELTALRRTIGPAFDSLYLQLLLRHHEGGLAMARFARDNTTIPAVTALARQIDSAQTAETQTLRELLDQRAVAPLPMN
ncbi:DUF305 domain-containing protein [Nocardia ninae]|uniref:DUF305 domain-containing protein n=1 Tax=Nocardia ninae NBRC 108245 TaxID=1210091 RepID=A0A511M778_9NOCA|nr:DUF305 domain-containing protein [Nocardia ninae]GEM36482.1 DUF305 domain-containing protein [Nocardia ninae NBRC 108245]